MGQVKGNQFDVKNAGNKPDAVEFYHFAMKLWNECWSDSEILLKNVRGKEIARRLIRAVGSISANIEEGYGRGFGEEYPHFLRLSRGSARERLLNGTEDQPFFYQKILQNNAIKN